MDTFLFISFFRELQWEYVSSLQILQINLQAETGTAGATYLFIALHFSLPQSHLHFIPLHFPRLGSPKETVNNVLLWALLFLKDWD